MQFYNSIRSRLILHLYSGTGRYVPFDVPKMLATTQVSDFAIGNRQLEALSQDLVFREQEQQSREPESRQGLKPSEPKPSEIEALILKPSTVHSTANTKRGSGPNLARTAPEALALK